MTTILYEYFIEYLILVLLIGALLYKRKNIPKWMFLFFLIFILTMSILTISNKQGFYESVNLYNKLNSLTNDKVEKIVFVKNNTLKSITNKNDIDNFLSQLKENKFILVDGREYLKEYFVRIINVEKDTINLKITKTKNQGNLVELLIKDNKKMISIATYQNEFILNNLEEK